jgi:hypothetical protein
MQCVCNVLTGQLAKTSWWSVSLMLKASSYLQTKVISWSKQAPYKQNCLRSELHLSKLIPLPHQFEAAVVRLLFMAVALKLQAHTLTSSEAAVVRLLFMAVALKLQAHTLTSLI